MDRIDRHLHEKSAVHRILSMMPCVLCAGVATDRTRSNAHGAKHQKESVWAVCVVPVLVCGVCGRKETQ